MINKEILLKCSANNFTKFGSKRFTLDELANTLGISKKTIYKHFESKEELVAESVSYLIENYKKEVTIEIKDIENPLESIIVIYKKGFEHLKHFKPSFIFGIKKYYPKASILFDDFRDTIVNETVYQLLEKAKKLEYIKQEVNLSLFCELYFKRFEEIALKNDSLFERYNQKDLLNHFVIYNLRGIATKKCKKDFFERFISNT